MNVTLFLAGLLPVFVMAMLLYGQTHKTHKLIVLVAVAVVTIPFGFVLVASQLGLIDLPASMTLGLMLYCVILNPGLLLGALTILFKEKVKR